MSNDDGLRRDLVVTRAQNARLRDEVLRQRRVLGAINARVQHTDAPVSPAFLRAALRGSGK